MTATFDSTGVQIQVYADALEEIITALKTNLALTDEQADRMRDSVASVLGNISRIEAEREIVLQEAILAVYDTLSWQAAGSNLDRIVALLGVTRLPALQSRVLGTATGTAASSIPDGTVLRYEPDQTLWSVDGTYTIGGGGTVTGVAVVSADALPIEVDTDTPTTGQWTIISTVPTLSTFLTTSQPIVGSPIETDAALRSRASVEAFRRGSGPLDAIEAAVSQVDGVTFVRAWENTGDPDTVDADGIPGRSINVVVEGGTNADIIAAILASRPAGIYLHGTSVVSVESLGNGKTVTVRFDRVANVTIWINCTITTSTSEEDAPASVTDVVAARLLEQGPLLFGIGDDVLPYQLAASLSDIPGIDAVDVQLSIDDGGTDPYSTAKRAISIRQKSTYDAARISVTEN